MYINKFIRSDYGLFNSRRKGKHVDMWTRPSDQPAPFGTYAQAMDNTNLLTTDCTHSLASRPHTHKHNNRFFYYFLKGYNPPKFF